MWSIDANPRRTRQAARGKERFLSATVSVIAQRGLDGVRFIDVARAAGTAISSLQYAFGSREDLLIASIEYAIQRESQLLRDAATTRHPGQRLSRLVAVAIGDPDDSRDSRLLWMELSRAAVRNPELRALYLKHSEAWLGALRDTIADGIDRRLFAPSSAVDDVALQILALLDGLTATMLIRAPVLEPHRARELPSRVIASLLRTDALSLDSDVSAS